jgi:tetratricopeptide (TPR) repeat protein
MTGERGRTPRTVEIGHLEARDGGTGVLVRVNDHEPQRRSTVQTTAGQPRFTGRDVELRAIDDALAADRLVVVHGAPGLGKSRLASEYAHLHADAYPGGMFWIPFHQSPPDELAMLLRGTDRPAYPDETVEDQCRRALQSIGGAGRALLIYDAIADEATLRSWLGYDGLDWHLIATSTSASWGRGWRVVDLRRLAAPAERALVGYIVGDDASDRLAPLLAERAGGITIELVASAKAAYDEVRRGRTVREVEASLARETASSFRAAWSLLSSDAQLLLQVASASVSPRIPMPLVVDALTRIGWTPRKADDAIDDARDRILAGGDAGHLQIHQLVARFVRDQGPLPDPIRRSMFQGLLATARAFAENPGSLDRRALMLAHSFELDAWEDLVIDSGEFHSVGFAIGELGQFAKALPWFERAVAAKENGDLHGRVDSESLGRSLHQVGDCYSSQGELAKALPWFERAVAAKENGDVHGRVDSESLGSSLHLVGYCYSCQGELAKALPWFERAVAAKKKGDVHARVDSASLGTSLHQVGYCYSRQGELAKALPWFERAVAAAENGDVHGRVDSESLGTTFDLVGYCYASQGELAKALPWFERAVAAAENGDVHGRVDSASLGKSLHQVGDCYARRGELAHALPWFERAVAAKEKGDVHGRVDSESLEISLRRLAEHRGKLQDHKV